MAVALLRKDGLAWETVEGTLGTRPMAVDAVNALDHSEGCRKIRSGLSEGMVRVRVRVSARVRGEQLRQLWRGVGEASMASGRVNGLAGTDGPRLK